MLDLIAQHDRTAAPVLSGEGKRRKHIVLVVPRGEAIRNFLYSDTLRILSENAVVTLLTVVDDEAFVSRLRPQCGDIILLEHYGESRVVRYLRYLVDTAHDRWLNSEVARNRREIRNYEARDASAMLKRRAVETAAALVASRPALRALTSAENLLQWATRPNDVFLRLFERLRPDLVFNCSHIHGPAGDLPLITAHRMGIPTAGFIFSWDNLTSRSRIFVPYDNYLVWNRKMRADLRRIYPQIDERRVLVTGTPQFDFHFRPEFELSREELCRRIGADPARPFVLYTTGIATHFPEEHRTVEAAALLLDRMPVSPKPQLVVRAYVKGTSLEMWALKEKGLPGVVFPPVLWDEKCYTPKYEDLAVYSSLLRHCSLGINAASTVSLELMMHDKPVVNLGFDPPGSSLPYVHRFQRHIQFDHFRPVAESGGTMVAYSPEEMGEMIYRGLTRPGEQKEGRSRFISNMFDSMLDGCSGKRVADALLSLTSRQG